MGWSDMAQNGMRRLGRTAAALLLAVTAVATAEVGRMSWEEENGRRGGWGGAAVGGVPPPVEGYGARGWRSAALLEYGRSSDGVATTEVAITEPGGGVCSAEEGCLGGDKGKEGCWTEEAKEKRKGEREEAGGLLGTEQGRESAYERWAAHWAARDAAAAAEALCRRLCAQQTSGTALRSPSVLACLAATAVVFTALGFKLATSTKRSPPTCSVACGATLSGLWTGEIDEEEAAVGDRSQEGPKSEMASVGCASQALHMSMSSVQDRGGTEVGEGGGGGRRKGSSDDGSSSITAPYPPSQATEPYDGEVESKSISSGGGGGVGGEPKALAMLASGSGPLGEMYMELMTAVQAGAPLNEAKLELIRVGCKITDLCMTERQLRAAQVQVERMGEHLEAMRVANSHSEKHNVLREAELVEEQKKTRRRAAGLAATDTLTTGFVVHLVVLLVGALRSGALHNAHDRCLLRITDAAVTRAWPLFTLLDLSALVTGAASVWCYTLAAGRLFAGLLGTSLVAYWVLSSRWLKSAHSTPFTTIALIMGVLCSTVGKYTVDVAGGNSAGWLACWVVWIGLHLADSLFPQWHSPRASAGTAGVASSEKKATGGLVAVGYQVLKAFLLPTLSGLIAYRSHIERMQLLTWF